MVEKSVNELAREWFEKKDRYERLLADHMAAPPLLYRSESLRVVEVEHLDQALRELKEAEKAFHQALSS